MSVARDQEGVMGCSHGGPVQPFKGKITKLTEIISFVFDALKFTSKFLFQLTIK